MAYSMELNGRIIFLAAKAETAIGDYIEHGVDLKTILDMVKHNYKLIITERYLIIGFSFGLSSFTYSNLLEIMSVQTSEV